MKLNRGGTETNDLRRERMDVFVVAYCDEKINVTHMNGVEEIAVTDCFSGRLNLPIAHRVNSLLELIYMEEKKTILRYKIEPARALKIKSILIEHSWNEKSGTAGRV